jgi:hypothetical protein
MSRARKYWGGCLSAVALSLLASDVAFAGLIGVGDTIKLIDREGNTGGGEFGVDLMGDSSGELFRTFCIERTEYIDFTHEFLVAGISTAAVGSHAADALDPETAYLYSSFRSGSLSGFTYTAGTSAHTASANALQYALWYFEGERGLPTGNTLAMSWIADAQNAVDDGLWTGLGGVRVLNLTTLDGRAAQDQLYLVPEPTTLALFGIGACLAGIAARRRRRS